MRACIKRLSPYILMCALLYYLRVSLSAHCVRVSGCARVQMDFPEAYITGAMCEGFFPLYIGHDTLPPSLQGMAASSTCCTINTPAAQ